MVPKNKNKKITTILSMISLSGKEPRYFKIKPVAPLNLIKYCQFIRNQAKSCRKYRPITTCKKYPNHRKK